jgi:hypothetical protein
VVLYQNEEKVLTIATLEKRKELIDVLKRNHIVVERRSQRICYLP